MTIRYEPQGRMTRSHSGQFVAFAEYDELAAEIVESAADSFRRVQNGEMTAAEAETALRVLVKLLMSY
jgi:hypothetical protein